jgi:putative membrane protein insertion efficiency factor
MAQYRGHGDKSVSDQPEKAWKSQYQEQAPETNPGGAGDLQTGTSARLHDGADSQGQAVRSGNFGNSIRDTFSDVAHTISFVFSLPIIFMILFYRYLISPGLPRSCNFTPTCSQYSYEAIAKHGLLKGGLLAAKRIWRCRGSNPGGYDPVP